MAGQTPSSDCSHLIDHSHVPEFEVALWVKITLALVYICIFVAGLLGNSVTIKATRILQRKGYLQKEVTDHMVSLACSDLLVILLGMPMEFYSAIWSPFSAPNGDIACKLYYFLFEACSYATVLHVATLSFERYVAICHPFRFKALSGPRTVKLLIAFNWGTSFLVALPLLFAMGTEYPLEVIEGYQRTSSCIKPTPRHYLPELKHNMTICTSLSSRWALFQGSIFSAFAVYITVLASVTFMCHSMMKALMIHKEGTVAVKGGLKHQQQYLRKSESSEGKSSRRQIILFLEPCLQTPAPLSGAPPLWHCPPAVVARLSELGPLEGPAHCPSAQQHLVPRVRRRSRQRLSPVSGKQVNEAPLWQLAPGRAELRGSPGRTGVPGVDGPWRTASPLLLTAEYRGDEESRSSLRCVLPPEKSP